MKKNFIGFYDKNGKPLYEGDVVIANKRNVTSIITGKGPEVEIPTRFKIVKSEYKPEYFFKELGPVDNTPVPQYKHTVYPYFEAKPKKMFWRQEDGTRANQWHYDKIKHLPAKVRYKSLYEVEKVC